MDTRRRDKIFAVTTIVVGAAVGSLTILAAFTPIGLVAAPIGLALIVFGALRLDRASKADK